MMRPVEPEFAAVLLNQVEQTFGDEPVARGVRVCVPRCNVQGRISVPFPDVEQVEYEQPRCLRVVEHRWSSGRWIVDVVKCEEHGYGAIAANRFVDCIQRRGKNGAD